MTKKIEVLGEVGHNHWTIIKVRILQEDLDLRSARMDTHYRWDELRHMSRLPLVGTTRRGAAELFAFNALRNNGISLVDLLTRSR